MALLPYVKFARASTVTGIILVVLGCGAANLKQTKESNRGEASADVTADPHANAPSVAKEEAAAVTAPAPAAPNPAPKETCTQKKPAAEFVTSLTHDLYRRGPTPEELKMAADPAFDTEKMVDWALDQPEYETGIAYFVSNLLRIEQNLTIDAGERDQDVIALTNDLKQEPVVFVQRNKDKPWPRQSLGASPAFNYLWFISDFGKRQRPA